VAKYLGTENIGRENDTAEQEDEIERRAQRWEPEGTRRLFGKKVD
jgi:hypothetical protein